MAISQAIKAHGDQPVIAACFVFQRKISRTAFGDFCNIIGVEQPPYPRRLTAGVLVSGPARPGKGIMACRTNSADRSSTKNSSRRLRNARSMRSSTKADIPALVELY